MSRITIDIAISDGVVWELGTLFTPFLEDTLHDEIQVAARELYVGLGMINADGVYLILRGLVENTDEADVPGFLRSRTGAQRSNAELLLSKLP